MKPIVLPSRNTTEGVKFLQDHQFANGHVVPLYDISTTGALNQIIGHAKFVNSSYGNVYYRGVNGLYDNVMPSYMRNKKTSRTPGLNKLLNDICNDDYLSRSLKLRNYTTAKGTINTKTKRYNKYCAEALLQHYAGKTRFIDVVDNHWVALWMGLQNFIFRGEGRNSCECQKRALWLGDYIEQFVLNPKTLIDSYLYEYIILLAMPFGPQDNDFGVIETNELVEVDLRKAIPSTFLRPHAQHALVIRKRDDQLNSRKPACFFDMASQVVAILRIRNDKASQWLGEGSLVSSENLFPSPSIDHGYNSLLKNSLFKYPFTIIKYY